MNLISHISAARSGTAILLVLLLLGSRAAAQEDYTEVLTTTQRFGDWIVSCEKVKGEKKSCVMTQEFFVEGQRVMQANFAKTDKGTQMTLIFPLGIHLPGDVQLEIIDHLKKTYQISFCSTGGCFVNHLLDPETVHLLRQKEKARLTIYSRPGQALEIPFSIRGFLDAHRKL